MNIKRKKISWSINDVFAIQLNNKKYAIGHILDQRLPNTIRIALYDEVIDSLKSYNTSDLCKKSDLISLVEVTKEQLDFGVWKVIGNKETDIPVSRYPNEKYRSDNWKGSNIKDAAIAEDFMNAFYGLHPWDDWYDPNFYDKMLVDSAKKPTILVFNKK